jgi:uncharacterized damage-inducible protein DinB
MSRLEIIQTFFQYSASTNARLRESILSTSPEQFLTDHRAQMLRTLHDFGAPTFEQDMIFYLWGRPPGR